MTDADPIALLFGGMEKLGPGDNAETLHVLRSLPKRQFRFVVDAGCGTGQQTLALARELSSVVHAVDSHQPFLDDLTRRAAEAHLDHLVQTQCLDMKDIPQVFQDIDLLWSEGAAYNIGFANALRTWRPALTADGLLIVNELSWVKEDAPDAVREFFRECYPEMRSTRDNIATAEAASYQVLFTRTLPSQSWVEGYYDILGPRAQGLLDHPDSAVRDFAAATVKEIEVFEQSDGSYGYVFYALEPI